MKKLLLLFLLISELAFAQTPRSRSYLQSRFETGDHPTQADYYDMFASSPNLVDDVIDAGKVKGRAFSSTSPTTGQVYVWNGSNFQWEPGTISGGGSATTDASQLTTGTLPDARLSSNVVTISGSQTISNKIIANTTIDYSANTILNLPSGTPLSLALPNTSGTLTVSFNQNKVYLPAPQSGNITLALGTGNIPGIQNEIHLIGDGTSSLSFPSSWLNGNGNTFDNSKVNIIYIEYQNAGTVVYNIVKGGISTGPDVTPPSYSIQNISAVSSSSSTFNVRLNEDGFVYWTLTTSSSAPSKSAILAGTGAVGANHGTLSITGGATNTASLSSLTPSTTYYLWSYAADAVPNQSAVQAALSFTTTSVDVTAPTLSSAATNTAGTQIILSYSETLSNSTPANSDFTLNLSKTVTTVVVSGNTVTLTVSSAYSSSDSPTLTYTPGSSKIKDLSNNLAASLSSQAVTNNVVSGSSINFTGNTTYFTNNAQPSNLNFTNGSGSDLAYSMGGWVKLGTASGEQYIFHVGNPGLLQSFIWEYYPGVGMIFGNTSGDVGASAMRKTVAYSTAGTWDYWVMTYSGSNTEAGIKIYKNGTLQSMGSNTYGTYTGMQSVASTWRIILGSAISSGTPVQPFTGKLADLFVANKELSPTEVSEAYAGGSRNNLMSSSFSTNIKLYLQGNNNGNDSSPSGYNITSGTLNFSSDAP
jgi:hypothetical protein